MSYTITLADKKSLCEICGEEAVFKIDDNNYCKKDAIHATDLQAKDLEATAKAMAPATVVE